MNNLTPQEMDKIRFTFDEKLHLYTLDGKPLTGCTTVLGVIGNGQGALIQWAANMAIGYIKDNYKGQLTEELLKEAKFAHRKKKEDAGQKGIDVHAVLEGRIKEAIKESNGFIQGHELNEEKQVSNFIDWALSKNIKFLLSEERVFSEKHWTGGTVDFVCEIEGKKYVGDIKTSSGIYDRIPLAQTAAYRMMLEEMGHKDFFGSIVINIKKNGSFDQEKDIYYSQDYQQDLRLFLGALEVYRVLNNDIISKSRQQNY